MKKFILFLFLISCSSNSFTNTNSNNNKNVSLDFKKNLTFIEFKSLLIKYNEISGYPNLNE